MSVKGCIAYELLFLSLGKRWNERREKRFSEKEEKRELQFFSNQWGTNSSNSSSLSPRTGKELALQFRKYISILIQKIHKRSNSKNTKVFLFEKYISIPIEKNAWRKWWFYYFLSFKKWWTWKNSQFFFQTGIFPLNEYFTLQGILITSFFHSKLHFGRIGYIYVYMMYTIYIMRLFKESIIKLSGMKLWLMSGKRVEWMIPTNFTLWTHA